MGKGAAIDTGAARGEGATASWGVNAGNSQESLLASTTELFAGPANSHSTAL